LGDTILTFRIKANKKQKILTLITIIIAIIFMRGADYNELPNDTPYWYTDGDGISDAVETNDANAHHNFDPSVPNANPSIAHGQPNNGWLEGGINLPDEGEGYYHFYGSDPVDFDDWGTLALINMTEGGGRSWNEEYSTFGGGFGDMSKQNGDSFPPHKSHQNGRDVDIRYVRKDSTEAPLHIKDNPQDYDNNATAHLMNCLIANGEVTVIYIDTVYAHLKGDILRHCAEHQDHFHVRIEDPDGTSN